MTPRGDARGHLTAVDDLTRLVTHAVDDERQNGLQALDAIEDALLAGMVTIADDALDAIFERLGDMRSDAECCLIFAPLVDDDGLTRQLGELAALLDVAGTYTAALRDARRQSVSEERGE